MTRRYRSGSHATRLELAEERGYDPSPGDGDQPVDTASPLSPAIVQWIHQGSATGCQNCGERCTGCDDRMCSKWGPAPRPCSTVCADCPCDCETCTHAAADAHADLTHRIERGA